MQTDKFVGTIRAISETIYINNPTTLDGIAGNVQIPAIVVIVKSNSDGKLYRYFLVDDDSDLQTRFFENFSKLMLCYEGMEITIIEDINNPLRFGRRIKLLETSKIGSFGN